MSLDAKLVRTALDYALDAWWRRGQLPPPALLRDGLLVLEAGQPLEEAQVSLLLRTAIYQRRGMLTALKHQTDPERTAVILADALLAPPPAMLTLAELDRLRRDDDRSAAWLGALPGALVEETSSADAGRRQRATELLYELRTAWPLAAATGAAYMPGAAAPAARYPAAPQDDDRYDRGYDDRYDSGYQNPYASRNDSRDDSRYDDRYNLYYDAVPATGVLYSPPGTWPAAAGAVPAQAPASGAAQLLRGTWFRAVAVLIPLVLVVLAFLWWQQQAHLDGMVFLPGGTYPVSLTVSGGADRIETPAFAIDRTEVTIGDYRRCTAAGRCPSPAATAGATRPNYLLDPAFNRYPVVNVDFRSAGDYCAWVGKRLPTAVEWEVAAGYAPSTQRQYVFPWGDQFQMQRANSLLTGSGDTLMVGSYQPIGDSPWTASDMAGNVAEWTATNVGKDPAAAADDDAPDRFLVKGGSFQDTEAGLAVAAAQMIPANTAAPWLGFRCAVSISDDLAAARAPSPNASPK